jgi:WD40 repeat protein
VNLQVFFFFCKVAVTKNGQVQVLDANSFQVNFTIDAHSRSITVLKLIENGRVLATTSEDRKVRTWDLITSERLCSLGDGYTDTNGLVQLKAGVLGTTREYDSTLKLWDTQNCKLIKTIKLGSEVEGRSWLVPINERLLAVGFERKVRVYDLEESGRLVADLRLRGELTDLDASASRLFAATNNGDVYAWDVTSNFEEIDKVRALKANGNSHLRLRVIDETRLITWYRREICVWDNLKLEGCLSSRYDVEDAQVLRDYNPNENVKAQSDEFVMTSSRDGYVYVWNLGERRVIAEKKVSSGRLSFIQLDSKVLYPEGDFMLINSFFFVFLF